MTTVTKNKAAAPRPGAGRVPAKPNPGIRRAVDAEPLALTPLDAGHPTELDHSDPPRHWAIEYLKQHKLFALIVMLPTLLAILYFGLIAADLYSSEARFIVRSTSGGGAFSSVIGNTTSTSAMAAAPRSMDETFAVNEYIRSRDAVRALVDQHGLKDVLTRPESDFINRFPNLFTRNNFEKLYEHYLNFVEVTIGETGISTLEVRSFRPDDSQAVALALLSRAEELINKLNTRARSDAVKFGEEVIRQAEERVADVSQRMTDFRNREMIVDPTKESATTLELVAQLTGDLALEKAQLDHMLTITPNSPQIETMRNRIRAMEQQINQQRLLVTGGDESMTQKLAQYEQIVLERDLAVKSLTSAFVSLENSRQEAQRQQLYLERVVEPHLADYPLYPRRLLSIAFVFGLCLCIFWIVRSVVVAILGHAV